MNIRFFYPPYRLAHVYEGQSSPLVPIVQNLLTERGFYAGPTSTVLDVETQEAVACFQHAEKLSITGILDPKTYCRLSETAPRTIEPVKAKIRAATGLARANILITKSRRQLTLFDGNTPARQYPVAIGKPSTPTPLGNYAVATKIPNPGGVLGTRWMGLNYDAYGIHGTNKPWLIGQMVSNGCVRMHNANAEELFSLVNIGTPIYIRE